jgi:hypothetical protein
MNQTETQALLSILHSVWPNQPVTEDTVTAWAWAFEDVPAAIVTDAAKRWMRAGKPFFPAPSDLRKLAAIDQVAPDLVPEAAWAEVKAQARRVGRIRTVFQNGVSRPIAGPVFSHPLIAAAVDATGWEYICTCDKEGVVKAQFTATLTALLDREVSRVQTGDLAAPLPGSAVAEGPSNVRALRTGRSA